MIATTLKKINHAISASIYEEGKFRAMSFLKLLDGLGKTEPDDEPLLYSDILRFTDINFALWAMQCEPRHVKTWLFLGDRLRARVRSIERPLPDDGSRFPQVARYASDLSNAAILASNAGVAVATAHEVTEQERIFLDAVSERRA